MADSRRFPDSPLSDPGLEVAEKDYEDGEGGNGHSMNRMPTTQSHINNSNLESITTAHDRHDLEQARTHRTKTNASQHSLEPTQSRIPEPNSLLKEIIFLTVIINAQFLTQAGLALSIVPLHIIGDSFGITNPGQLSWFAAGYSLTVGTFILIAGRLGDLYGHKRLFVIGFSWFALWSFLCGFSVYSNQIFFDCARALQGIGPALCLPNGIAILGRTYPQGRRKEHPPHR